jgi:hypothetical protein
MMASKDVYSDGSRTGEASKAAYWDDWAKDVTSTDARSGGSSTDCG